jgi:hypothetical protein
MPETLLSRRATLLLALACCAAASANAQRFDVGTRGASVELPKPWKREKSDPDLGDDQFQCQERKGLFGSQQVFVVVQELEEALETKAQLDRALTSMATVGNDAKTELVPGERFTRAVRKCDAVVNGFKAAFRLEVISKDGLSYTIMSWAGQSDRAYLDKRTDQFLDKFTFPVVPLVLPEARIGPASRPHAEATTAVLQLARRLGALGAAEHVARVGDGGRYLVASFRAAHLVVPDQRPEALLQTEDYSLPRPVAWNGRWLVRDEEDEVHEVRDGDLGSALPFRARALAALGKDLALARAASTQLQGVVIAELDPAAGSLLVRRDPAGGETPIASLPGASVESMVADPAGALLLIQARAHRGQTLSGRAADYAPRLVELEVASGGLRELGEWSDLRGIAPAQEAWLVTGRPRGRPSGVYLVGAGGDSRALLLGAQFLGVDARDGRITFAVRDPASRDVCLYEGPAAELAKAGQLCQPFAASHLDEIGRRLLAARKGSAAPRTASDVRAAFAAADDLARALVGTGLPRSPRALDALGEELQETRAGLAPHGRIVLALVLAASCLERGASWVEGADADWLDWACRKAECRANASASAHAVGSVVSDCLDDSEGSSNLGTCLDERAQGRTLLIGLDPEAMDARAATLVPAGLGEAIAKPDGAALRALLAQSPRNAYLRACVYRDLLAGGHGRVAEGLGKHFAATPERSLADLRAWLGTWSDRVAGDEAAAVVTAATAAVHEHPGDAALCYFLGVAYRKAKPDQPDYARTCFRKVVRIEPWSAIGKAAKAALDAR